MRRYNTLTLIISIVVTVVIVFLFLPRRHVETLRVEGNGKIVAKLSADGKPLPDKYFVYLGDMDAVYGDFKDSLNKPIDRIRVKFELARQSADAHLKAYLKEKGEAATNLSVWKSEHSFHVDLLDPAISTYNKLSDSNNATDIRNILSSITSLATLDRLSLKINVYLRLIDMNERKEMNAIKKGLNINGIEKEGYSLKEKVVDAIADWLDESNGGRGEIKSYLKRLLEDRYIPKRLKEKCERILRRSEGQGT